MSMNGTDVLLLVNTGTPTVPVYEVMGSQRDMTIDETTEEVDVSAKDTGRARRVIPGRYGSTVSLDALYVPDDASYQALKAAKRNGELILVAEQEEGEVVEVASALITSISRGYPDQGPATISVSLTIDGDWEEVGS